MGKTIKLTGPVLNNWFAEALVAEHGAEGARERVCGSAEDLRALSQAIAAKCLRSSARLVLNARDICSSNSTTIKA